MNKTELVEAVAAKTGVSKNVAGDTLNAIFDNITQVLTQGDQVIIPGFGTFSVSHRAARTGRNPQTGEAIQIKAARVAKFKAGKGLKDAVNIPE